MKHIEEKQPPWTAHAPPAISFVSASEFGKLSVSPFSLYISFLFRVAQARFQSKTSPTSTKYPMSTLPSISPKLFQFTLHWSELQRTLPILAHFLSLKAHNMGFVIHGRRETELEVTDNLSRLLFIIFTQASSKQWMWMKYQKSSHLSLLQTTSSACQRYLVLFTL